MSAKELLTEVAGQQLELVEAFDKVFDQQKLPGGTAPYRVKLSGPSGLSTGGGVQALQHIKLVPEGEASALVAGWADPVKRVAELRAFEYLEAVHAARFKGAELPLDGDSYRELVRMMNVFFVQRKFSVEQVAVPPPARAPEAASRHPARRGPLVGALVAFAALLIIALVLLLRKSLGG